MTSGKKLLISEVKDRLKQKGFELLGEYIKFDTRTLIRCHCNNSFMAIPRSIFIGETKSCGCFNKKLTEEEKLHKRKEYWSFYYKNNKVKILEKITKNKIKNIDKSKEYSKKYYQRNKNRILKREKIRKVTDINFKLAYNLRRRLNIALRNNYKMVLLYQIWVVL